MEVVWATQISGRAVKGFEFWLRETSYVSVFQPKPQLYKSNILEKERV